MKAWVLQQLAWGGLPQIRLIDGGEPDELVLVHQHDGRDLQLGRASETMRNLSKLWGGPVQLLTTLEKHGRCVLCRDGEVSVVDTREGEAAAESEGPEVGPTEARQAV